MIGVLLSTVDLSPRGAYLSPQEQKTDVGPHLATASCLWLRVVGTPFLGHVPLVVSGDAYRWAHVVRGKKNLLR